MKKKVYKKNIIGKQVTVINSNNKTLEGLSGIIVDETKNMITLKVFSKDKNNKENKNKTLFKKIIKKTVTLQIKNEEIIHGEELIGNIYERIKK